ncbi:speckle-type POZ protein B-like [Parasteatoda tepidariorum]|uniref:speckle-type POZ protein B-like n=1 Tax=Parasteatoda tepidariorum TaxID=114398 RepID=UPI00077FA9FE|nr:speckle-type POZ protein B-like [Parasteatoda tepidariorum]
MSDIELIEFTYSWTIENYSMCYQRPGKSICSPDFEIATLNKSRWSLHLYPRGFSEDYKEFVSCFLCSERSNISEYDQEDGVVDFEIKMVDTNGETLRILRTENCLFQCGYDCCGWRDYIKRSYIKERIKAWPKDNLVLICYIATKKIKSKHLATEGLTRIMVDKCSFDWKISVTHSSNWSLSKQFTLFSTLILEIILSASEENIKISILKKNSSVLDTLIRFRLTLLNFEGFEIDSKNASHIFESDPIENTWNFPLLITKEQLELHKSSTVFSLVFMCSVSDGMTITHPIMKSRNELNSREVNCFPTLQEDLQALFKSKKFCDVKLRVGDELLLAHKSFLAARSPVFAAMFDQEMIESQTGIVDICDVSVDTLNKFLEFVYTGTVSELDTESSIKLLVVADKYQVLSLKEKCCSNLMRDLSEDNAGDIFDIADCMGLKLLSSAALDFVKAYEKPTLYSYTNIHEY